MAAGNSEQDCTLITQMSSGVLLKQAAATIKDAKTLFESPEFALSRGPPLVLPWALLSQAGCASRAFAEVFIGRK